MRWRGSYPADLILGGDSLERALFEAATGARYGPGRSGGPGHVPLLGRGGELPNDRRLDAVAAAARAEAVPVEAVGRIDAGVVAAWIVAHYRRASYPAVVIGSPHGSAVHLAAALGAAWLPATFAVTVPWPGGTIGDWVGARAHGAVTAARILAANRDVAVRQVHDPVQRGAVAGATVSFRVRWRKLPRAYRKFLRNHLQPRGEVIVVRDRRTWPVLREEPGLEFQIGSPAGGRSYDEQDPGNRAFRELLAGVGEPRWPEPYRNAPAGLAETACDAALSLGARATHEIGYTAPEVFSAAVADLLRRRLRAAGGGRECVIECGRLLDARRVQADGLVPYWCESASSTALAAAEWWLAGNRRFDTVTVLPEPPGVAGEVYAGLGAWRSLTAFGLRRGELDRYAAAHYPMLPFPSGRVAGMITPPSRMRDPLPPLTVAAAVRSLRKAPGLTVL